MTYREQPLEPLSCPRCNGQLTPTAVARCTCGVWVEAFVADIVLTAADRQPRRGLHWWRVRAPCPQCGVKMDVYGTEPGLLQGCDVHGFWIDADAVALTGLTNGVDFEAIDAKRSDEAAVEAEHGRKLALLEARARAELPARPREPEPPDPVEARLEPDIVRSLDSVGRRLYRRLLRLEIENEALSARITALESRSRGNASDEAV